MNKTFTKSLYHLAQPASVITIILLFVNNHIIRVYWPSWFSGKLGDFAWLYFMPFALAAIFAWIIPSSLRNHSKIVGILSFGMIGALYILGNTFLATNQLIIDVLESVLRTKIIITKGFTDLFALISLVIGWLVWQKGNIPFYKKHQTGIFLLPIVAVLTIADSAAADYGIQCLDLEDNQVVASTTWRNSYVSKDGGFSWEPTERENQYCQNNFTLEGLVVDPEDKDILYRIGPNQQFEYSNNKGKNWISILDISLGSESEKAFYRLQINPVAYHQPGPFQGIIDPNTENLILAMGLEGVLVRTPTEKWQLVSVGEYGYQALTVSTIPLLLVGELILTAELALLLFCTLSLLKSRTWFKVLVILLLWGLWLFVVIFLNPALNRNYGLILQYTLLVFIGALLLWLTVDQFFHLHQEKLNRMLLLILKLALLGAWAFIIPYFLWGINMIPSYETSKRTSSIFYLVVLLAGIWQVNKGMTKGKTPTQSQKLG